MNISERARAFRHTVLPDCDNSDRVCAVLDAVCLDLPREQPLARMKAIAHLVGVLGLDTGKGTITEDVLLDHGFDHFVCLGVALVQGTGSDTHASYWETLRGGFDAFKLVRAALAVVEVEDVAGLPSFDRRRRCVLGDVRHMVVPMLSRTRPAEARLRLVLQDLLRSAAA